jgi:hypothetical protein
VFGHSFTASGLMLLGIAAQWGFAALAHSLPAPDDKSGKFYLFVNNLTQFCAANLTLMRQGVPPCQQDEKTIVISDGPKSTDRVGPCK